jgi:valyl-tRNA synthetase
MPFISEEIWQALRPYLNEMNLSEHLAVAKFPVAAEFASMSEAEALAMEHCIEATETISSLRALVGWAPGERARAVIKRLGLNGSSGSEEFKLWREYAATLGRLESFENQGVFDKRVVSMPLDWADVGIEPPEKFDFEVAKERLRKKLAEVEKHAAQHAARIDNDGFKTRADPETQKEVQDRLVALKMEKSRLEQQLRQLGERT